MDHAYLSSNHFFREFASGLARICCWQAHPDRCSHFYPGIALEYPWSSRGFRQVLLFANVYLDPLDKFVKHRLRVRWYLRYADDFILLARSREELEGLLPPIATFLTDRLKLSLHPDKIVLRKLRQGIDFVGYVVLPYHIALRTRTKRRMFRRVENNNLSSYVGMLTHCNGFELRKEVTEQVRNLSRSI